MPFKTYLTFLLLITSSYAADGQKECEQPEGGWKPFFE